MEEIRDPAPETVPTTLALTLPFVECQLGAEDNLDLEEEVQGGRGVDHKEKFLYLLKRTKALLEPYVYEVLTRTKFIPL